MNKRQVFIIIGIIIAPTFLNISIITEIFAQKVEEDNSFGLSGGSIEEAQGNITELTANKTGFGNESTVGLSGRSIEEAQGNITELTANKTGFGNESTVGLSGRSIEEANK